MPIYAWWWELQSKQEEARSLEEISSQKPWQRTPAMREARKRHKEKMRLRNGASSESSG